MEKLHELLNKVSTELLVGTLWHGKVANECRKISIRGYGRMHEHEANHDFNSRLYIEKILRDKLQFSPMIDTQKLSTALSYSIENIDGFKQLHKDWIERERAFVEVLNELLPLTVKADLQLYKEVCELKDWVEHEIMCIKLLYDRFSATDFYHHDYMRISQDLHEYFENQIKQGEKPNWNIG
jgi:hypothetical protein